MRLLREQHIKPRPLVPLKAFKASSDSTVLDPSDSLDPAAQTSHDPKHKHKSYIDRIIHEWKGGFLTLLRN